MHGNQSARDMREVCSVNWMHGNRELVKYVHHHGITQSQHCNNDNVMDASAWIELFGGLYKCQNM